MVFTAGLSYSLMLAPVGWGWPSNRVTIVGLALSPR